MATIERPQQREGEDYADWFKRQRQWEIDNGEACYQCGGIAMLLSTPGHRKLCHSCRRIEKCSEEVDSTSFLRCPRCRHRWGACDEWERGIFEDGPHDVQCPSCDHEFEVETTVSYSFESPAILDGDAEEGD